MKTDLGGAHPAGRLLRGLCSQLIHGEWIMGHVRSWFWAAVVS